MGAGKTAIGRRLARKLDWHFMDLDQAIQERTGVDIPFIFEKEGEVGFRQRETRLLHGVDATEPTVIATGGGVVMHAENRQLLKTIGFTVFLSATIDSQWERTRLGKHRPLLEHADPRAILEKIYVERLPLYRECAMLEVCTDGRHVEQVARDLADRLQTEFPENFDA
jgi:shikimate kinase